METFRNKVEAKHLSLRKKTDLKKQILERLRRNNLNREVCLFHSSNT